MPRRVQQTRRLERGRVTERRTRNASGSKHNEDIQAGAGGAGV